MSFPQIWGLVSGLVLMLVLGVWFLMHQSFTLAPILTGSFLLAFAGTVAWSWWRDHRAKAGPPRSNGREAAQSERLVKQSMGTWSPFQSQEVQDICAHLTKAEKNHVSLLGLLWGVWGAVTFLGIVLLIRTVPTPGNWIVAFIWAVLFIVSVLAMHRMTRHFLCSTTWAKQRGFVPERLHLFSFRGGNLWKGFAVLAAGLLFVFVQSKVVKSYLGLKPIEPMAAPVLKHGEATPSTAKSGFGPVMERTLLIGSTNPIVLLDLDSGEFVSPPASQQRFFADEEWTRWLDPSLSATVEQVEAWLQRSGADLAVARRGHELSFFNGVMNLWRPSLDATLFERVTPDSVMRINAVNKAEQNPATRTPPLINLDLKSALAEPAFLVAFQTQRGVDGVMQVVGLTENPRGVKIRYKLVQPTTSVNPPPSVKKTTFGPVLEFTLRDPIESRTNCFIDFEADRLVVPPADLVLTNRAAVFEWVRSEGVDAIANTSQREMRGLLGYELTAVRLADEEWERPTEGKLGGEISKQMWNNSRFGGLPPDAQMVLTVNTVSTDPKPSKTYGFRTSQGTLGLLQFLEYTDAPRGWVKLRYKLMQKDAHTSPARSTIFNTSFAEPPKLQFLAWQDEWKTNKPFAARHPDGSPVTNATELQWLKDVQPGSLDVTSLKLDHEPRFLHLWFSHPAFTRNNFTELSLLNDAGNPIKLGGQSSVTGGFTEAGPRNGNLGWSYWTVSPGETTNHPARVTVRVRYTVGPLERAQDLVVIPESSTSLSLEGGSQLNGVGQTVDGRAFVAIAVAAKKMSARQFDAVAIAKDGREIPPAGSERGGAVGGDVRIERFEFETPLAEVAKFIIGTRPIQTNDWKDVVLPQN